MEVVFPVVIVAVFIAVFALLAYFGYQQQQKRLAEMAALAATLGWQFDSASDSSHDDQYAQLSVFTRGHSRYAYNTLRGTLELGGQHCPAKMGDYHYRVTSGSGKSRRTQTYRFSYLLIDLPFLRAPQLFIRREGLFDALAGALGFDDIDFESAEFSQRFHVKSADKRFAYDVVHPRMMEFLLAAQVPVIEIEQRRCCLYDGASTCWSAAEFQARLDFARNFFQLWPKHVVATLNTTP